MEIQLPRAHNHPVQGPVVVVHSPGTVTHDNVTETPMHAIGPFRSEAEADLYHRMFNDMCEKVVIDLIEPVWD